MESIQSSLHGFQISTIEPAFEGELIRAIVKEGFNPAVLIISKSICDTTLETMLCRIRKVSEAQIILASESGNGVSEDAQKYLFSLLELPQEAQRIELIIKSAVRAYTSLHINDGVHSVKGEHSE